MNEFRHPLSYTSGEIRLLDSKVRDTLSSFEHSNRVRDIKYCNKGGGT